MSADVIVSTSGGRIRGSQTDSCYQFLGIPYGRAERFQAPVSSGWEGVLDCLEYGPVSPQPNFLGVQPRGVPYQMHGAEEGCLHLNVWTTSLNPEKRLPVVIYIFPGGFQVGRNSVPKRSGDLFMENDEMVFVSPNYRLGVLGFLQLGDEYPEAYRISGNNGILDLRLAIQWVHDNAQAFGGDPDRITIMTNSAGAKTAVPLLTLPDMREMCSQLLLESGGMQAFRTPAYAGMIRERYLSFLPKGISPLEASTEQLIQAQMEFCNFEGTTCYFGPVLDGNLFPETVEQAWEQVLQWKGSVIIGSCRNELIGTACKPAFLNHIDEVLDRFFGESKNAVWDAYHALQPAGEQDTECWNRILSDFLYRYNSEDFAGRLQKAGNPVWLYSFEYLPASHGQGFWTMLNQYDAPLFHLKEDQWPEAQKIADFLRKNFRSFICTGLPDESQIHWPRYDGGTMLFVDTKPHIENRPDDTLTAFSDCIYHINGK